jgi:tRNA 2-thiocytidine biosynthesis protein TtcA
MLREWEKQQPGRSDNMLRAMAHVVPSHLADRNLHPFTTLQPSGLADPMGDKAFDEDDPCAGQPAQAVVALKSSREST